MTATLLHILVAVHTLIGAVSTLCLAYLYYAAWRRLHPLRDKILVFALAWPLANLVIMAANGMVCPLQNAALALSGTHGGWVRDIYLVPQGWLRAIPFTYPAFYLVGAGLVSWRARKQTDRPGPRLHRSEQTRP